MPTNPPSFDIIVAHDLNRGIGKNNALPWTCPADMRHFKQVTTQGPGQNRVIMGRRTWESLPPNYRPLPNRENVVVSQSLTHIEGSRVVSDLDAALANPPLNGRLFVIGGAQLYKTALAHPRLGRVYVTKIFDRFDCDTVFADYSHLVCRYASNIWVGPCVNCAFFEFTH